MTIYDLKKGELGVINNINGDKDLRKRLLALGCIEGTEVKLVNYAPLGDPILINFKGFDLAIRKKDAKNIYLK